jgi:hypothetical protein
MVFCILATGPLAAQQRQGVGNGTAALNLMLVVPQGEFKEASDDLGVGLGFDIAYVFDRMPLAVGFEGGFAVMGQSTFNVPLGNIQIVYVDVTSTNDLFLGHVFARLQPQHGAFRPYVEGLLGLSYFVTSSSVKNESTNEEIASSINNSDVAFSYGASGGIAYRVYSGGGDDGDAKPVEIYIDARLRYLYGGTARYYKDDAVYLDQQNNVKFDESKRASSTTDMLTPQLGVQVRF